MADPLPAAMEGSPGEGFPPQPPPEPEDPPPEGSSPEGSSPPMSPPEGSSPGSPLDREGPGGAPPVDVALAPLRIGGGLGRTAASRKEALGRTAYAWLSAVRGVFRSEVGLPPSGLQLPSEKFRCAFVMLGFSEYFPLEIVRMIVECVVLTTPHYGMDPVRMFRWFWKQPSPTFPWLSDVTGSEYDSGPPTVWHKTMSLSDVYQPYGSYDFPPGPDPLGWQVRHPPESLEWTDLRGVLITNISGSAMAHRTWGGLPGEDGGTARWYPTDWDVFIQMPQGVLLFEMWLEATFRRVKYISVRDGDDDLHEPTMRKECLDAEGRFKRNTPTSTIRSWKWNIGKLKINAILGLSFVDRYDFEPAATATTPPFDNIYRSFYTGGEIRMYTADKACFEERAVNIRDLASVNGSSLDLDEYADTLYERHRTRVRLYQRRYPTARLVGTDGTTKMFWYDKRTLEHARSVGFERFRTAALRDAGP